jgi:hypothetical protein
MLAVGTHTAPLEQVRALLLVLLWTSSAFELAPGDVHGVPDLQPWTGAPSLLSLVQRLLAFWTERQRVSLAPQPGIYAGNEQIYITMMCIQMCIYIYVYINTLRRPQITLTRAED